MKNKLLPLIVLIVGAFSSALRWLLYVLTTDVKNLIPVGNPLELILWIFTAGVAIMIPAAILPLRKIEYDPSRFRPNLLAALGSLAAAVGIGMTVLQGQANATGTLGLVWKSLGFASAAALAVVSYCRIRGQEPFFGMHTLVCIFFAVHLVTSYRGWSSNPQLMDYVFSLFGSLGMMLFAFYHSCLEADMAKLRLLPLTGLLTAYCCLVALSGSDHFPLYLGGALWTLTNLCRLYTENESQEAAQ